MKNFDFKVYRRNQNVTEAQLIAELKRVYKKLKKSITKAEFDLHSKYGSHLVVRKIGWNIAKVKAGIPVRKEMNITDKKLIDNIMSVWLKLKRQPKKEDLMPPISKYSISPYNAQVYEIQSRLGLQQGVGTVDKFQGRQAPVVIYSMATSTAEDAPRGMDFLYSPNRFNVAVSRAQAVFIMVAAPAVFEPECKSPEQIKMANPFCYYLQKKL